MMWEIISNYTAGAGVVIATPALLNRRIIMKVILTGLREDFEVFNDCLTGCLEEAKREEDIEATEILTRMQQQLTKRLKCAANGHEVRL